MKQGYNARLDESLGAKNGKKSQSLKSRRDESKINKPLGCTSHLTGISSQVGTKLRDWAIVQAETGCNVLSALS